MSAEDLLAGVRLKIERAKKHIADLDAVCRVFKNTDPYRVSPKFDPDGRSRRYCVEFVHEVPTAITLVSGDAVNNLRCALDHLAMQLFLIGPARGDRSLENKISFPIAKSATNLESRLEREVNTFGQAVVDAIGAIEPYKGGKGHCFWVLSELNNLDKHRLLITAALGFSKSAYAPSFRMSGPEFVFMPRPGSCPLKVGDELLFTRDMEMDEEPQFGIEVAFAEPEIVEGEPVVPFLHQLANLVDGIASHFAAFL
jgi:hypothetical protein